MTDPVFPVPAAGRSYVQVTATGEWERATRLAGIADAEDFLAAFGSALPPALGIELLWEGPPVSFVGARLDGERVSKLPDLVRFLVAPDLSGTAALAALSGGELGALTIAEVGAINAWLSVGAASLWNGTTWRSPELALAERPDLRACAYPVGLEVGHEHAWYAVEVSDRTGGVHRINQEHLERLAAQVRRALNPA